MEITLLTPTKNEDVYMLLQTPAALGPAITTGLRCILAQKPMSGDEVTHAVNKPSKPGRRTAGFDGGCTREEFGWQFRGDLNRIIIPELLVKSGDVVRVTLQNGDGMPHELFLPDFDAKNSYVNQNGDQTDIIVEVGISSVEAMSISARCRAIAWQGKKII
jgi:hypothetical protein